MKMGSEVFASVSIEKLRKVLIYSPSTGHLTWDEDLGSAITTARYAGKLVNNVSGSGYVRVSVGRVRMLAHRVCYAIYYGAWPDGVIDHINGNRTDNRIENLRVIKRSENQKNMKLSVANTSGQCGVHWNKRKRKWMAAITVNYENVHLGYFEDIESAKIARRVAESEHGFHENHGVAR